MKTMIKSTSFYAMMIGVSLLATSWLLLAVDLYALSTLAAVSGLITMIIAARIQEREIFGK